MLSETIDAYYIRNTLFKTSKHLYQGVQAKNQPKPNPYYNIKCKPYVRSDINKS